MDGRGFFKKKIHYISTVLICVALSGLMPYGNACSAEPDAMPSDMQAKLFLTALTYVNNLAKGDDNEVEIGFVYSPDVARSRQQASELLKACAAYQDKTIGGRIIKTELIEYAGREHLREMLARHGIEALYIAHGSTAVCSEVTRVTRELKILSFTSDKLLLAACGISLGIGLEEGKPKVYLNLESAQAESMEFSGKLIRVATVVPRNQ